MAEKKDRLDWLLSFAKSNSGYILIVIGFVLFLLTKNSLFSFFVLVGFGIQLIVELKADVSQKGWKNEIMETVGILVVIFLAWKLLGWYLNTDSPVSAIATCSMAPNLMAGDMVIISNTQPNAPSIDMTAKEFYELENSIIAIDTSSGKLYKLNYSLLTECTVGCKSPSTDLLCYRDSDFCSDFAITPERFVERRGSLDFMFARCVRTNGKDNISGICTTGIRSGGSVYLPDLNNSVVAYSAMSTDVFASVPGDIIHRLVLLVHVDDGRDYYLVKGDNNDRFDLQIDSVQLDKRNSIVINNQVRGLLVSRIPLLGYFKLFISGYIDYPEACDYRIVVG